MESAFAFLAPWTSSENHRTRDPIKKAIYPRAIVSHPRAWRNWQTQRV